VNTQPSQPPLRKGGRNTPHSPLMKGGLGGVETAVGPILFLIVRAIGECSRHGTATFVGEGGGVFCQKGIARQSRFEIGEGDGRRELGLGGHGSLAKEKWIVGRALIAKKTLAAGHAWRQHCPAKPVSPI
jgi:hypothetical protein